MNTDADNWMLDLTQAEARELLTSEQYQRYLNAKTTATIRALQELAELEKK